MAHGFGTLADGGELEQVYVRLGLYRGDRLVGMEPFEPEDLDIAQAHFEELRPGSQPDAARRRARDRISEENMIIRDAQPVDQDAIRDVTLAAYGEYAAQMQPDHWEAYRLNILATLADVQPAEQLVAEEEGALVGTVLLYPPRSFSAATDEASLQMPWPEVRLLAVAPPGRGRGVGVALMRECVRRARRSGATVLGLHTTDMMQAAMRMYERMGFVRAPELDFHPLPDLIIKGYRLELGAA